MTCGDVKEEHDSARAVVGVDGRDCHAIDGDGGVQVQRHDMLRRHPHILLQQHGSHRAAVDQACREVPGQPCSSTNTQFKNYINKLISRQIRG